MGGRSIVYFEQQLQPLGLSCRGLLGDASGFKIEHVVHRDRHYFRHLFQELPIILAPGAFLAAHKRDRPQSTAERSKWEDIAGFDSVPDQLGDDPWVAAALIDGGVGNQPPRLRPPGPSPGTL